MSVALTRERLSRSAARLARMRTLRSTLATPLVSFTFDDIPESAFTQGATILEKSGVRGTFYIAGGLVGTMGPGGPFATQEQCVALHERGHEIGCHTFSHPSVRRCSATSLESELARNQAFFSRCDPSIVLNNFAYPYNEASLGAKWRLQRHFQTCRGGVPGVNAGRIDPGFLRAVEIIETRLDRETARRWIDQAVATRGWLIFLTHDVSESPGRYGCTPGLLNHVICDAKSRGCEVVTVREAVRRVGAGESLR